MSGARARNTQQNNNNEESFVLLRDGEDLPPAELFAVEPQTPPRLNVAQRILGGANEFLFTVAPVAAASAIQGSSVARVRALRSALTGVTTSLRKGDFVMTAAMAESNYAVTAIAVIGTKEVLHWLRSPGAQYAFLLEKGEGSFALGLARDGRKKLVAAIPPVLVATISSLVRDHVFDYAMKDPENNQFLVTTLLYFTSEPMRTLLIATPSLGLYMLGQLILDKADPSPDFYKSVLHGGMRIVDAIALAEMTLLVMNTMIGDETRHSPYTLLLAVFYDQFLLQTLRRLAEVSHPLRNIPNTFTSPRVTVLDDDGEPEPVQPSRLRDGINIGTHFAVASVVFAGAALANRYASAALSAVYQSGGEILNDPTLWLASERLLYQGLLLCGAIATEEVVRVAPSVVQGIYSACAPSVRGFFSRNAQPTVPPAHHEDDLEAGLAAGHHSDEDITGPATPTTPKL